MCYKNIFLAKTWPEAREYCQKEFTNGDLAAISNWKIKQFLENVLTKSAIQNGLWIGGNKVDGQWQWSNGDVWDFENWRSGQPNPDASKEENSSGLLKIRVGMIGLTLILTFFVNGKCNFCCLVSCIKYFLYST